MFFASPLMKHLKHPQTQEKFCSIYSFLSQLYSNKKIKKKSLCLLVHIIFFHKLVSYSGRQKITLQKKISQALSFCVALHVTNVKVVI